MNKKLFNHRWDVKLYMIQPSRIIVINGFMIVDKNCPEDTIIRLFEPISMS